MDEAGGGSPIRGFKHRGPSWHAGEGIYGATKLSSYGNGFPGARPAPAPAPPPGPRPAPISALPRQGDWQESTRLWLWSLWSGWGGGAAHQEFPFRMSVSSPRRPAPQGRLILRVVVAAVRPAELLVEVTLLERQGLLRSRAHPAQRQLRPQLKKRSWTSAWRSAALLTPR